VTHALAPDLEEITTDEFVLPIKPKSLVRSSVANALAPDPPMEETPDDESTCGNESETEMNCVDATLHARYLSPAPSEASSYARLAAEFLIA
jgi:hypothetical protein